MGQNFGTVSPQAAFGWLTAIICSAAACNGISGANDILLVDGMGEDDSSNATSDDGSGQGGTSGAGTFASGNGGGTTGNGSQSAVSSGVTAGPGGGDPTTTVASSSSTGPTDCEYPSGPYGVGMGDVVPPTLSWQGYGPGASQSETISMAQFHDCDGTLGINALAIDTSQFG